MTSSASSVLSDIREQKGVPREFVIRVFSNPTIEGLELQVSFAPEPAEGDEVTEAEGTTLCVDQDLAEPLSDAVIDAKQTPAGQELVLRSDGLPRPGGPEGNGKVG